MTKNTDLKYWLALIRIPFIGPQRFFKLKNGCGKNISEIFAANNRKYVEKFVSSEALHYIDHPDWDSVEEDLRWSTLENHHLVTLDDPDYPHYLREITDPPLLLYVRGNLKVLNTPQIALVGTRTPSFSGRENAFQFACALAKANITVTSGLARGIDSYGHQGALKAGGQTIAVLGSGINRIYPKEHCKLAEKITTQGAIVSEFPPNAPPLAKHFPQRNRIISGLSRGVLVVEAALKSGSLVTARLASEQGRDVFAIPGSIQNTLTKGCHYLIQQGAKLVTHINDIAEECNFSPITIENSPVTSQKPPILNPKERKIWDCIDFEPASMEMITLRSGLTIGEVSSILLSFEINDLVASTPTGYLRRKYV